MPSTIGSEPLNVCHLLALIYGAAMACALWKNGCASFGALAAISGDNQKSLFSLRDVDLGIWKDTLSVLSGEAADVTGVEMRDQDEVDVFRRIACAAEAARQAPERSPTKPGAGTRIDEDQLLASVDQETCFGSIQHVRILVQCL
jgi:hypothetical protein